MDAKREASKVRMALVTSADPKEIEALTQEKQVSSSSFHYLQKRN